MYVDPQSPQRNGLETPDKKPPLCFPSWRAQRLTPKSPMGGTVVQSWVVNIALFYPLYMY